MQIKVRLYLLSILLVLAFALTGCVPGNQYELCGTYAADYDIAKERLSLEKDGTFIQEVTIKASSKYDKVAGTWKYDPITGDVSLDGFMVMLDPLGNLRALNSKPVTNSVKYPANNYFYEISIGTCDHRLYKKIN